MVSHKDGKFRRETNFVSDSDGGVDIRRLDASPSSRLLATKFATWMPNKFWQLSLLNCQNSIDS